MPQRQECARGQIKVSRWRSPSFTPFPSVHFSLQNSFGIHMIEYFMALIAQRDVPRIKDICDSLGTQTSSARSRYELASTTHGWRREFVTEDGIRGRDLRDWNSWEVQDDLHRMTVEYLEKGGYGHQYWPAEDCLSPRTNLEYPKDKER